MLLHERACTEGRFLFRWRSFLPLIFLPVAFAIMLQAGITEDRIGAWMAETTEMLAVTIAVAGLGLRWISIGYAADGTSGRNTRGQRADTLNTTGLYSVVRNPLYLGNFLIFLGILLSTMVWYLVLIGGLAWWLYIERIIAVEESYLAEKFGDPYRAWASRTPAFLPRPSLWRRPELPFRLKKVLRQEPYGVLTVALSLMAVDAFIDLFVEGKSLAYWLADDTGELIATGVVITGFVVFRVLKKRTRVLEPAKA